MAATMAVAIIVLIVIAQVIQHGIVNNMRTREERRAAKIQRKGAKTA